MSTRAFTIAGLSLVFGASLALVAGVGHAAPPVVAQPQQGPTAQPAPNGPRVKRIVKMTTQATAAVAGETRNVKAKLTTPGGDGVGGKSVSFKVSGQKPNGQVAIIMLGNDTTNSQGEATLAWKVPELGAAAYKLTATFGGDDDTGSATDDANFGIIKGLVKVDLGNVTYGALDSHGGPKFHTYILTLKRDSDGQAISRPVKVTTNNGPVNTVTPNPISQLLLQPDNAQQWSVKAVFEGDDSYQPVQANRTYNRVPGS